MSVGSQFAAPRLTYEAPTKSWSVCYQWLLVLSIVGYPFIAASLSAVGIYSTAFSIGLRSITLLLGMWCLWIALSYPRLWPTSITVLFLLLWCVLFARFVWDAVLPIPLDLPWMEDVVIILGIVLVPSASLAIVPNTDAVDKARRLIVLLGITTAFALAISLVKLITTGLLGGRFGLEALNPISIGHLGLSLMIVSSVTYERVPGALSAIADSRTVRWIARLCGFGLLILAASKGPIAAFLAVVFISQAVKAVIRGGMRAALLAFVKLAVLVALIGALAFAAGSLLGLSTLDRFTNLGGDESTSIRVGLWSGALMQFESSPFVGSAFVELEQRFYPHNIVVEALMVGGIPALLMLVGILAITARACLRVLQTPWAWVGLLYIQSLVGAMTSGSLYYDGFFWGLTLAVCGVDSLLAKRVTYMPQKHGWIFDRAFTRRSA